MTVFRADEGNHTIDNESSITATVPALVGDVILGCFVVARDVGDVVFTYPPVTVFGALCGAGNNWNAHSWAIGIDDSNVDQFQELTWSWVGGASAAVVVWGLYRDDGTDWAGVDGIYRACHTQTSPNAGDGVALVVRGLMSLNGGLDETVISWQPASGTRYVHVGSGEPHDMPYAALAEEAAPAQSTVFWDAETELGFSADERAAVSWVLSPRDPIAPGPIPDLNIHVEFPFAPIPQVGPVTPQQHIDRVYGGPVSEPPDPDGIQVPGVPYVNP